MAAVFDVLELESESERRSSLRVLRRDLRAAAETLGLAEIRYLVDLYYQIQEYRKATGNQERALETAQEPHLILSWAFGTMESMEDTIKAVLDRYTQVETTGMGAWAREVVGIGPVLSAGLLAHLDIAKAPTVGHIWRFAGLDPTQSWEKGQKRPWNAALKVLCWKIGQSFVKVSNHPRAVYGHLYRTRKAYELERNQSGALAEQAAAKLARFKIGKDTDAYAAYSQGLLPPAHLDQRAQRYAVKLFLAAWHEVAYFKHYGKLPPLPYTVQHLGHADVIWPPNADLVPGLREAKAAQGPRSL